MMRALHLLFIAVGAAGGATAVDLATHETPAPTAELARGRGGRPGADSTRVAALLTALGNTDPVICDLIGDQLGNFWMGHNTAGLGRFSDAPAGIQGAKDSLGGTPTDSRRVTLLSAP